MKTIISFIFAALLPVVASAYDVCVDGIYYNLSGDEATVTFKATEDHDAIIISGYEGDVVVPASITYRGKTYAVTGIKSRAFKNTKSLTSVTIPESVTSLGAYAFYGCSALSSITIPENVTRINEGVFSDCNSLISVTIPNNVTSVDDNAFDGCSRLASVTLPDGLISIGNHAFQNCNDLTGIVIPNSVTSMGSDAFNGCKSLTDVTIPGSVTSIGNGAFKDCSSLTSLTIEDGVKIIGGGAFYGCSMASVTLPASVTSIGSSVFSNCANLTSVNVPESVTSVGAGAFSGTPWYDNQPDGLVYIGKVAYRYKGGMPEGTEILIKEGTVQIAENTFYECLGLAAITIPSSVTDIGPSAFYSCYGLSSVTIPENVTSIGNRAFCGCRGLTSINIPQGVTCINEYTFQNCYALTSVIIPDGVKNIGEHAFTSCQSLTSITIPESVTSIKMKAFMDCSGLTSISIHNGVTTLGISAFNGCTSLKSICIPSSVTFIDEYAFNNCTSLTDVFCLAENVPSTKSNAFNKSPISVVTLHVPADSVEKYQKSSPWSSFGSIVALPVVTFTQGQMATIILPTAPDASKGKYYRLDRREGNLIVFAQELHPQARTPYIIVPNEDFSIDLSTLDLTGLTQDAVSIEGVSFIGSYTGGEYYEQSDFYINLIDVTEDCQVVYEGDYIVGALRAYLQVDWEDPISQDGTRAPQNPREKMEIILLDDGDGIGATLNDKGKIRNDAWYDLLGRRQSAPQRGLNIIRMSDGSTRKVMMK